MLDCLGFRHAGVWGPDDRCLIQQLLPSADCEQVTAREAGQRGVDKQQAHTCFRPGDQRVPHLSTRNQTQQRHGRQRHVSEVKREERPDPGLTATGLEPELFRLLTSRQVPPTNRMSSACGFELGGKYKARDESSRCYTGKGVTKWIL